MPSDFLEKTLEDIIFENKDCIHNYGLPKFKKTTFRQFILPSGKKLDIFSYDLIDGHIVIDIYELKRYEINTDAICQAYNYFMEVTQFTAGKFKSIDIHIIMIGRYYDPVMIFEKMNLPFSVYTYDYQLNGMTFIKRQDRKLAKTPNDDFCFGLWGFGSNSIYYPKGQPDTVNLANIYSSWKNNNKETHNQIVSSAGSIFTAPIIREISTTIVEYIKPKSIITEHFPLQPAWSLSFSKEIPPDEHMFDFDIDESDYEEETMEADYSDYEPDTTEDDIQRPETLTLEELDKELSDTLNNTYDTYEYPAIIPLNDPELQKVDEFIRKINKKYA